MPKFLTNEIGSSLGIDLMAPGGGVEENPELRFPFSAAVYDRMRKTDGQVASVYRSISLPLRRANWHGTGDDVEPKVTSFVEANLGLQVDNTGRRRTSQQGISWDNFLRQSLIHLAVGFMPFEKVYDIATERDPETGLPIQAYLGRLSPRMPRTIADFELDTNGDLRALWQWVNRPAPRPEMQQYGGIPVTFAQERKRLPVETLVMFVNDQEGADYTGQSILRAAWIDWTIKSKLIRINAIGLERNAVGMPKVTYPSGGDKSKAHQIGRDYRASERGHVVVPDDHGFELIGVTGQTKDPLPAIKYHDEMIGRSALAMFLNLGHDRGSQSLGETFIDIFTASINAVVAYIEEVVTEQIVRDLVRVNFGPDEPYPAIVCDEITPETALKPADMASLVQAKILTPDGDLEDDTRRRFGLVKANPARRPKPVVVAPLPNPDQNNDPNGTPPDNQGAPDPAQAQPDGAPKTIAAARSADGLEAMRIRANDLRASIEARKEALALAGES